MTTSTADKSEIKWSFWNPEVVDHQLNPIHLAIGRRGYHVQSEVLHIPYRWGPFSPGPARLQVAEVHKIFLFCILLLPIIASCASINILVVVLNGWFDTELLILTSCIAVSWTVFMYYVHVGVVLADLRKPGFVWKDWGPEQDV
ncbi:hypothetical protein F5Y08DRAFT_334875 [Xylaria arbuscula]|nr:hypothetical protein F5Y08DRAFT_334875 [Xylaria arbuscula]